MTLSYSRRQMRARLYWLMSLLLVAPAAFAQMGYGGYVEAGASYHAFLADRDEAGLETALHRAGEGAANTLDEGLSDWYGVYLGGLLLGKDDSVWRGEATFQRRFGQHSFLYSASHSRMFGRRWISHTSLSSSSNGFYNPRLRLDVQAARKWLAKEQLITLVGLSYIDARDVHRDYSALLEAHYYLSPQWVAQGGVRWTLSTPGSAHSRYYSASLTHGRPGRFFIVMRGGWGNEAYVVTEPLTIFTDYLSHEVSLSWRQWIRGGWGVNLSATHYGNTFYQRRGIQFGLFKHMSRKGR